jgi:adenylyltransferase/sulfurtransferase
MTDDLNPNELDRYQKHLQLPEVGVNGQLKLKAASVLVVGVGGLGSPAALYLAAAGVGKLGLVDDDRVALSNLQRQVLHSVHTLGEAKPSSGAKTLLNLNPEIEVKQYTKRLTGESAADLIKNYDIVMDCTDNYPTRLVINRACVMQHKPMVHGAVFKFEGQVSIFHNPVGPCYTCLYSQKPAEGVIPDPSKNGLISTAPGVIGVLQANEVIKLLVGIGKLLVGRLLLVDLLEMKFQEVKIKRNPQCPDCGSETRI